MNLIGKYFRPIGSKIQKLVDYKGSTIKPQAQAWQHRYKLHIELLQNKQKFSKYMNDQRLQEFINQHYFLGDIVRIANMIAADSSMYNRELTDSQVSFLAFTHNLYHHETIKIPELIQMISSHLLQKIADKNYAFASRQLQKNYLEQIYFLTCRDNLPPQLHREIVTNLVRFVERKWLIDKQSISEINDKTLDYLWETLPYIPFEKGTNILSHYQTVLLTTIQYEALQLRVKRDRGIIQKDILNEGIERFSELAEICIRVANSRNKYVDIFSALPTEFSSQQVFADWLVVLREFMIEPLLKRLDYKKMDTYHGKLAYQNRKYNKKRGYLSIQAYCQSLLFLNVYNPRTFAYFFEADDKPFVSNSSKGSMQEQRNNP